MGVARSVVVFAGGCLISGSIASFIITTRCNSLGDDSYLNFLFTVYLLFDNFCHNSYQNKHISRSSQDQYILRHFDTVCFHDHQLGIHS